MAVPLISEDLLARARRYDLTAVEQILAGAYPAVCRIAHGLIGHAHIADAVTQRVLLRGARVLPTWRAASSPENWFYHHTLLACREFETEAPAAAEDPLVILAETDDPAYLAFVRAVRHLPQQQREAFVLNEAERLNERLLGVAMDCSMDAARVHLRSAVQTLAVTVGEDLLTHAARMARAYALLTPRDPDVAAAVGPLVRRMIHKRRLRLFLRLGAGILIVGVVATLLYFGWRFGLRYTHG